MAGLKIQCIDKCQPSRPCSVAKHQHGLVLSSKPIYIHAVFCSIICMLVAQSMPDNMTHTPVTTPAHMDRMALSSLFEVNGIIRLRSIVEREDAVWLMHHDDVFFSNRLVNFKFTSPCRPFFKPNFVNMEQARVEAGVDEVCVFTS